MQIRQRADMDREEAIMLLGVAETEVESLRQQLAEAHATIGRREAVIRLLEADIATVGAGGAPLFGDRR